MRTLMALLAKAEEVARPSLPRNMVDRLAAAQVVVATMLEAGK